MKALLSRVPLLRALRRPDAAWAMAMVVGMIAAPARADLVVELASVTAARGSSGSFDVLLTNTNAAGGDAYAVSSDTVVLNLSAVSGVTITGATIDTTVPYIYRVSGTTFGVPFVGASTATGFTASDSEFEAPYEDTIAPGQTFGLAHVTYSVAADAPAGMVGAFSLARTNFSDLDGNTVAVTLSAGTFTIAAVPEPSTLVLAAAGLLAAGAFRGPGRNFLARRGPPAAKSGCAG